MGGKAHNTSGDEGQGEEGGQARGGGEAQAGRCTYVELGKVPRLLLVRAQAGTADGLDEVAKRGVRQQRHVAWRRRGGAVVVSAAELPEGRGGMRTGVWRERDGFQACGPGAGGPAPSSSWQTSGSGV